MSTTTPIPAAELIRRMPTADEIRARIAEVSAERKALMALLRAALSAERRERAAQGVAADA